MSKPLDNRPRARARLVRGTRRNRTSMHPCMPTFLFSPTRGPDKQRRES